MTLALTITAVAIVIVSLFAVIIELATERDEARAEADRLSRELEAAYESLNTTLDEHALCPVPARPNLRVVRSPIPMQRRGEEWDRIVQAIEGEQS